jgi:hypothetical protein
MNQDLLWPCVCILAGLGLLVLGIVIRKKLKTSESWPKTIGIIRESTVKSEWVRVGSGNMYIVSPKVIYEYEVDGEKYTSSQLALVEHSTANENLAKEKSERHPVGQQVTVYYNPRKPDFATLEIGDPTGGKLPFGIIIFGIVVTIAGIVWFLTVHK